MDIKDVYKICKDNYEKIQAMELEEVSESEIYLHDPYQGIDTIKLLESTNFLGEVLDSFEKAFAKVYGGSIRNEINTKKEFIDTKKCLLYVMKSIIKTYEEANTHQEIMPGLDIKLPINDNFTDFKKNIDDLEFVLTKCPFFQSSTEYLRFKSVHNGSVLLTFVVQAVGAVSTSVLLNNIAAFIDKCIIIRSHHFTNQQQKRAVELSKVEQKEKEEILKYLDKTYKILVDSAIKELEDSLNYKIKDGDELGRTEQAVERLNKLLDKGVQIYSTLGTSEETKALFEPIETKYLSINNKVDTIEGNTGE